MAVTYSVYEGEIGPIYLMFDNGSLFKICFKRPRLFKVVPLDAKWESMLRDYFMGRPVDFGVEMPKYGTDFQKKVWRRLTEIPPGSFVTYGQLAKELDTHPRAIGAACRANPLPIVIPCHRVVYSNGEVGGYVGTKHLESMKKHLLRVEKCNIERIAEERSRERNRERAREKERTSSSARAHRDRAPAQALVAARSS